jgi:transmembrane sensor
VKKQHIKQQSDLSEKTKRMITGTTIEWSKSKEEIWAELEQRIEAKQPAGRTVVMGTRAWLAVAATIALLTAIAVFMQVYTKTVGVPSGKHSTVILPDGSQVRLNAQSAIIFKPLMWNFSRNVRFEGEAYFEVKPGKKFEVVSAYGKTSVLGTSFNIYARNKDYQVTCVTGKVMVMQTQNNKTTILYPGQQAVIKKDGLLDVFSGVNTEQTTAWLNNILTFTSMPLPKVFEEISRQYGIVIRFPGDLDYIYTGTFKKTTPVENALNLVCKPFMLKLNRTSEDEYAISRNQ